MEPFGYTWRFDISPNGLVARNRFEDFLLPSERDTDEGDA